MTRTFLVIVGLSLAGAELAEAQIIEAPRSLGEPLAWTSLSIGWLRHQALSDPESGAQWDFGDAPQWRGSLEMPIGRGATIGVAATTARVPLIYNGSLTGMNSCTRCDADANITQYMGNVHIGGGGGFHQVIDLSAGMTVFSNFRRTDGSPLGPGPAVSDFSFAVGYGFGYSFSPRMQIMLLQDYGLVIHKRQSGQSTRTAQQSTLRVGGRFGLGDSRR
ncbi:MAG: hypothetical protein WD825_14395 [Gemmatimonadaceae bacterium]